MEHDSSVSDIPLPAEEAKSKETEKTMQSEKIDESKTDSEQSAQDAEINVQLTTSLESSDQCSKEIIKQNEEAYHLDDIQTMNEQTPDVQLQEISVATITECSNEIVETVSEPLVESDKHTAVDNSKLIDQNVQPNDNNTDPPDSSEPKQVTVVTDLIETSVDQEIDADVQVATEDIESDFSLHVSLDSSESSALVEPGEVLRVVQNVANINEISEGMECEIVMEQIEEMQSNQIVHESIVTSEVSETVAQSAVQVGVAETVVAQSVELNSNESTSSDEQETEEDSIRSNPYVNGVSESTNETSHDSTTPASPAPLNDSPEINEPAVVSDATGTNNSEPESSLDDTEEDEPILQESNTEDKNTYKMAETETSVKNVQESSTNTPQASESAVSSKDDETTVGSAEDSVETENTDQVEISEVKSESADSNSDKVKDDTETCGTEEMTTINEPVISFTPSECDPNDKAEMDTNSGSEDIVEAFLIEEVSDEAGESSTASSHSEPIIVEPSSDDVVQNNEFNQMTEVIVLETVTEETAMEVDGTLTASVAENVMIEIIDDTKSVYKSKDTDFSIEIIEEQEIAGGTEHNPEVIQEVTIESKDTGDTVKEETKYVTDVSNTQNVSTEEKNADNYIQVQESLPDSGASTVTIIDDTTQEAPMDNSVQVKSESKSIKVQEKRSRVTRSSHARSVSDVPCHVLGRNIDNPTEDLISNGRTPPKPRLGVKVPYRFLTSQIVSKQDLADELLELVAKRNPDPDPPAGGDIFFAQKLTQRLANKIAMSESKRLKQQATAKISSLKCEKPSGSSTLTSGIPDDALSTPPPSDTSTSNSSSKIVDNSDLLAILEGDVDVDWTKEIRKNDGASTKTSEPETVVPPVLTPENIVTVNTTAVNTPPKLEPPITSFTHSGKKNLDPELERQLALKQLQDFPKEGGRRERRPLKYVPQPQRKSVQEVPKVRKENVPVVQTSKEQSAPVPAIPKSTEYQKQTVVKYKKIIEKQLDKGKKPKEAPSKKSVDSSTKFKDDFSFSNKETKPTEGDIIEPTLTARKVMKTYSRKETILKVPAELEYIVNDSDTSALTETGEVELTQESLPGPSNIKSELVESDLNSSKKVTDEATANPKLNADNDKDVLVKDNVVVKGNEEISEKNVTASEKLETNKKEEAPQPAGGSGKKTVNKTPAKKAPQIKRAKRSITEINKPEVTLVSKRARIIKKRVIWDPAEVPKARATAGAKKPQPVPTKATTIKSDKLNIPEKVTEVKEDKKAQDEPVREAKSEKQTAEKDEEKLSNGQSESKIISVPKNKLLSRVALSKKAKKLLMKRKLRPLKSKLIRTSRGELKKSLALSKKKKQVLVEIAKKVNKPKKTELDRLLMDEGAVNMLYSVKRDQKLHGDMTKRKKSVISIDRAQKDLINRTKVVKDVITQSSNQEDTPKALRKKDSPTLTLTIQTPPRKKSRDSIRSSLQSPPPSPSYIYPPRPEASRIIRRHSSSFSSECSSPRRLSIDTQQQAQQSQQTTEKSETKPDTEEQDKSKDSCVQKETPELQSPIRSLRRKGVPIYERKQDEKTYKGKKKLLPDMEPKETEDKKETNEKGLQKPEVPNVKEKLSVAEKRKLNTEMSKNFSKQQLPKKRTRLSKTADEEIPKVCEDKNLTKVSKSPAKATKKVETIKQDSEEKQRMTTRQVSLSTAYKEISLRKIDNLVQIILTPTFTKLKNPITLQVTDKLSQLYNIHILQNFSCIAF